MKTVVPSLGDAPTTKPGTAQMIADARMTRGHFEVWAVSAAADANATKRG
jgi:hypothetical protein